MELMPVDKNIYKSLLALITVVFLLPFFSTAIPASINSDRIIVSVGYSHSFVIKDSKLWAWGGNWTGQRGDGYSKTSVYAGSALPVDLTYQAPINIKYNQKWHSVSAGMDHSLAINNKGELWSWGSNRKGHLGIGSFLPSNVPIKVGRDKRWKKVSAGTWYSMGIKSDGTLWGWGSVPLSKSDYCPKDEPLQLTESKQWQSLSAGANHALFITNNGTLWAWGSNQYGQLEIGRAHV